MRIFRIAMTGDFLDEIRRRRLWRRRPGPAGRHAVHPPALRDGPGPEARRSRLLVAALFARGHAGAYPRTSMGWWCCDPGSSGARSRRAPADLVVIGRSGAGYDKIDLAACTEHGVAVFNAPMALNHSTASSALLFMLALAKRLPDQERVVRQGRWDLPAVGDGGRDPGPDARDRRPGPQRPRAGAAGRAVRDARPRLFAARRPGRGPRAGRAN